MKHRRFLSTLLALAILLSCVGWTPSRAEEAMPEVQTEQSQAAAQTEATVYTEQMSREELPEIVAQEAPLNHGHVGRLENEEADNLNQFIFLNQDGSKTMYLYDHPVKYRDEAGNIHDISLNIADTDDTAYPFRTEANWAVTAFPRELANGITLESESANAWLEMFFDQLCRGESVANAAKYASEYCPGPSLSTDEVVICGDKDAILFD